MLHATLHVAQVLDSFVVSVRITEFAPGVDPVVWDQKSLTLNLPDDITSQDALSITLECIRIWSEMTISH